MILIVVTLFCLITWLPLIQIEAYPSSSSSSPNQHYLSSFASSPMVEHYSANLNPYFEDFGSAGLSGSYIKPRDHISRWLTYGWGPGGRFMPSAMRKYNKCIKETNDPDKCTVPVIQKRSQYFPSSSISVSSSSSSPIDPSTLSPSIKTVDEITNYLIPSQIYDFNHYN